MNSEVDFSRDEHFLKLLARKPCSLTMINLEIARDAYPDLDFAETYKLAKGAIGQDPNGYRREFLGLIEAAGKLRGEATIAVAR